MVRTLNLDILNKHAKCEGNGQESISKIVMKNQL